MPRKYIAKDWKPVTDAPGCEYLKEGGYISVRIPDGQGWFKEHGPAKLIAGSVAVTVSTLIAEAMRSR